MKKILKNYYVPIIFLLSCITLLIRSFYSFCWSDETFYFATAHRFFQGDSIFLHDWFPTQLSSVILLPIYALYVTITGSTTGVILFFRILYVIFETVSGVVVYHIIKPRATRQIALICALFTMFYTHLNIATLSYYTISVHCFLLAFLILYHYYQTKKSHYLIIAGSVFAISVLALPTMAVAYILVMTAVAILLLLERVPLIKRTLSPLYRNAEFIKVCGFTLIGILIPAVIFLIFLLCNVSLKDFVAAIPYVLSDEEHITSFIYPLKKFFIGINEVYGILAYISYILLLICTVLGLFLRNYLIQPVKTGIILLNIALFAGFWMKGYHYTGYMQTALCIFSLVFFLLDAKRDYRLFLLLFASGMIFSIVYSYSSNGYLYILSMGHFIASIGGIIFIYDYFVHEEIQPAMLLQILSSCVIVAVLLTTITLRIINVYRDAPLTALTAAITQGPAKGLHTTTLHKELYDEVYDTLMTYCQSDSNEAGNQTIFITKLLPFGYMCTDLKCASPTTWRTALDSKRLQPYYEINPDRIPDLVLVLDEEYGAYDTCGDVVSDPIPNANSFEGFLPAYLEEHHYQKMLVPCGTIYQRTN